MTSRWRAWLGSLLMLLVLVEVPRAQDPAASTSPDAQGPIRLPVQKRVLVLYPNREDQPAWTIFEDTFESALDDAFQGQVDVYREYLDYARFALTDEYLSRFRRFVTEKYTGVYKPDAVLALSTSASEFRQQYGEAPFPQTPVLLLALTKERPTFGTTLVVRLDPDPFRLALRLQPGTKRVFVVAGTSDSDRTALEEVRQRLRAQGEGLEFSYLIGLSIEDIERTVSDLPRDSIIYFVGLSRDGAGRNFEGQRGLDRIARAASVPIYVYAEAMVGHGTLGGTVWSTRPWALKSAEIVGRLLRGESPDAIPVTIAEDYVDQLDWRQLRRWGIDENLVPPGTQVLFREPTIWDRYRAYIIGAVAFTALQATVIGALLVQRRQRRRVEVALRASEATAQASVREVRELAGRLITAREDERARIARDLHDDIGQRVASVSIGLSRVKSRLPDAAPSLGDLEQQTMRLSGDLRHLSHELHPATLVHLGLLEALRERCEEFQKESGAPVQLEISERWRDQPDPIELCCYRVVQEVLRNVATHAQAHHVTVALDCRDGLLLLQVTDDGRGFDMTARARRTGLGLISLRERVRMLGGTLEVTSAPGAGTIVTVRLPEGESKRSSAANPAR